MALHSAGIQVELREVKLSNKPREMLELSDRGTVPVLQLDSGKVLLESLDIMHWALTESDPCGWLIDSSNTSEKLIQDNDSAFKRNLDCYKYWARYPEQTQIDARRRAEVFLVKLENLLKAGEYFLGASQSISDVAIFPFIRQFAAVDPEWFELAPYPKLRQWLIRFLSNDCFIGSMHKYPIWQEGDAVTLFPSKG